MVVRRTCSDIIHVLSITIFLRIGPERLCTRLKGFSLDFISHPITRHKRAGGYERTERCREGGMSLPPGLNGPLLARDENRQGARSTREIERYAGRASERMNRTTEKYVC